MTASRANAVILGMHRSGTSALTGALCQMGWSCGLPASRLEPDDINEKGYFERKDVVAANEALFIEACRQHLGSAFELSRVLRQADMGGHAWFLGPWALARGEFVAAKGIDSLIGAAVGGMLSEVGAAGFALKDPRLCLALDHWRPFLPPFQVISIVRPPLETARSLERLNKVPRAMNLAAWCAYTLGALRQVRAHGGLLVLQPDLLQNPEQELSRILAFLGHPGDDRSPGPAMASQGSTFLDPRLVHHRVVSDGNDDSMAARAYELVRRGQVSDAEGLLECFVDSMVSSEAWTAYCFRLRMFELQHDIYLRDTHMDALMKDPIIGPVVRLLDRVRGGSQAAFRDADAEK